MAWLVVLLIALGHRWQQGFLWLEAGRVGNFLLDRTRVNRIELTIGSWGPYLY